MALDVIVLCITKYPDFDQMFVNVGIALLSLQDVALQWFSLCLTDSAIMPRSPL